MRTLIGGNESIAGKFKLMVIVVVSGQYTVDGKLKCLVLGLIVAKIRTLLDKFQIPFRGILDNLNSYF